MKPNLRKARSVATTGDVTKQLEVVDTCNVTVPWKVNFYLKIFAPLFQELEQKEGKDSDEEKEEEEGEEEVEVDDDDVEEVRIVLQDLETL